MPLEANPKRPVRTTYGPELLPSVVRRALPSQLPMKLHKASASNHVDRLRFSIRQQAPRITQRSLKPRLTRYSRPANLAVVANFTVGIGPIHSAHFFSGVMRLQLHPGELARPRLLRATLYRTVTPPAGGRCSKHHRLLFRYKSVCYIQLERPLPFKLIALNYG